MRFKNKAVIITGSSSGIGKTTALAFAREGANVVINSKNEKDHALSNKKAAKPLLRAATSPKKKT